MSLLARIPDSWRKHLDDDRLWIRVAYIGIVALFLWLAYISKSQSEDLAHQARLEAVRMAEKNANAQASYDRCIESIPLVRRFSTHVAGVNEAFEVLLTNSLVTIANAKPDDPLQSVRIANVNRLAAAYGKVAAIKALPVPDDLECLNRRREVLDKPPLKKLPAGYQRPG